MKNTFSELHTKKYYFQFPLLILWSYYVHLLKITSPLICLTHRQMQEPLAPNFITCPRDIINQLLGYFTFHAVLIYRYLFLKLSFPIIIVLACLRVSEMPEKKNSFYMVYQKTHQITYFKCCMSLVYEHRDFLGHHRLWKPGHLKHRQKCEVLLCDSRHSCGITGCVDSGSLHGSEWISVN